MRFRSELRRVTRAFALNLDSTCRLDRFSGSLRSADGAVLSLEVGSEPLMNDRGCGVFGVGFRGTKDTRRYSSDPVIRSTQPEATA